MLYNIAPVSQIESGVSLKQDLQDAIDSYLINPNNPAPVIRDLRNKYILGSDLLKMRKNFEKSTTWNLLPQTFKKQWAKQMLNYTCKCKYNSANKKIKNIYLIFEF